MEWAHSILTGRSAIEPFHATIFSPVNWFSVITNDQEAELTMNSRIPDTSERIDRKTSRSICEAVGERLQRNLRPEAASLPTHLERLMDELRKQDANNCRSA